MRVCLYVGMSGKKISAYMGMLAPGSIVELEAGVSFNMDVRVAQQLL